MSILTCKVDNQGRIMLPAKWRKEQGIQAEGEVLVELRDNCLLLQTREQAVRDAQSMVRRLVGPDKSLVDDLLEQRRRASKRNAVDAGLSRLAADSL